MPRDVSLSDSKCLNGGHEWVKSLREIVCVYILYIVQTVSFSYTFVIFYAAYTKNRRPYQSLQAEFLIAGVVSFFQQTPYEVCFKLIYIFYPPRSFSSCECVFEVSA